jgi:phosphoglucosamine mutase
VASVREYRADLGIALDGDADRLIMVDGSGRIYNGDELLYLMVKDRLATGPVDGAVGTLMTNMAVEVAFKKWACPSRAPRWATATCWKCCRKRAGCWAAKAPATCWRWTSTPPATASSRRCRCCGLKRAGQTLAQMTGDITLFRSR